MGIDTLLEIIKDYAPSDKATIIRAYEFASRVHRGVFRKSGEPYISHPVAVACILAEMHADVDTIVAGILHDTIEDGDGITKEYIAEVFNHTVANLVDGVTKLPKFSVGNDRTLTEQENKRKIFESVTFDIRILIIKLADRLHNMRTLEYHKPEKQQEIAEETMNIFVPFATLIGSYTFKQELEDLSFKFLQPEEYLRMQTLIKDARLKNYDYIEEAICQVSQLLNSRNVPFEVKLKVKNIYGLFKRLKTYQDISEVHDLFAIKFMLDDEGECYKLKDQINAMFPFLPEREKDYIKYPKTNMYQSLHTTVRAKNDQLLQFQVKTKKMYQINAYGLTAYWDLLKFDNAPEHMQNDVKKLQFFKLLDELVKTGMSTEEFNKEVQKDILSKNIYVKTPNGEIIELPAGSTPVDFAFKIHTDLGLYITSAIVNGQNVPLDYQLRNRDTVEIISNRDLIGPREDIYNKCKSESVKRKIKKFNDDFYKGN